MTGHYSNHSCPFCSDTVRSSVFYNRADNLAIYNIAPVLPGHSLVIPRKHILSIAEFTDQELSEFFITARNTLKIIMKAFHSEAFDWSLQEKPEAGQTIEHLHLHIVPRIMGDLERLGDWYPLLQKNDAGFIDSMNRPRLPAGELSKIVLMLRDVADRENH
jgi:bis(5'-adenosyl)-triphosphatase